MPTHRNAEDDQLGTRTGNGSHGRIAQLAHIFLDENGYDDLNVVPIRQTIEAFLDEVENLEREEDSEHSEDLDHDLDAEVENDNGSIGDTIVVQTAPRTRNDEQEAPDSPVDGDNFCWMLKEGNPAKSVGVEKPPEKNESAIIAAIDPSKPYTRKNSTRNDNNALVSTAPAALPQSQTHPPNKTVSKARSKVKPKTAKETGKNRSHWLMA